MPSNPNEIPTTPRKQLMGPPPVPSSSATSSVVVRGSRSLSVTPTRRPASPAPSRQPPMTEPVRRVKREISVVSTVKSEYDPTSSPSPSPARRLFGDGEMWPAAALRSRREATAASSLFSTSTRQGSLATDVPRSIRGVSRMTFDYGGLSRPRRRPSATLSKDGPNGTAVAAAAPTMPAAIADEFDRAAQLFDSWASKVAVDVDADDSDDNDNDSTGATTEVAKKSEALDLLFSQLFWERSAANVAAVRQELGSSAPRRDHHLAQLFTAVESCAQPILEAALAGFASKSTGKATTKVTAKKAEVFAKAQAQCNSLSLSLDTTTADRAWRALGRRWESPAELALIHGALSSFVKGLQRDGVLDCIDVIRCLGKQVIKMIGKS